MWIHWLLVTLSINSLPLFFINLKWSWACSKGEEGDCRLPIIGKRWAGTDPCGAHHQRRLPGGGHGDPGALLWPAAGSLWPHSVHEVSNLILLLLCAPRLLLMNGGFHFTKLLTGCHLYSFLLNPFMFLQLGSWTQAYRRQCPPSSGQLLVSSQRCLN